jgi:hypothetical protein
MDRDSFANGDGIYEKIIGAEGDDPRLAAVMWFLVANIRFLKITLNELINTLSRPRKRGSSEPDWKN